MKKFILNLAFIGAAISSLTMTGSYAQTRCTASNNDNCGFKPIIVSAESIKVSSCSKNAGIIQVTVTNKLLDTISIDSITLTGPTNSQPIPQFNIGTNETKHFEFTGLANGSYTVTATATGCTFTCTGIIVNNRKLNCLPLLCCCK